MVYFSDPQKWFFLAGLIIVGWLLRELAPVLSPFLIAFVIAYLGAPLVDYLESYNRPRILGVLLVFTLIVLLFICLIVVLIPIIENQLSDLLGRLPNWIEQFEDFIMPHILFSLGLEKGASHLQTVQVAIIEHWEQAGGLVARVITYITASGVRIVALLANMILIPVITFYLLIDWHILMQNLRTLIPRQFENRVISLLKECDEVLSAFLRGQLLVMLALSLIYIIGLLLIGVDFSILLGLSAGLVSFVPYLGLIVGVIAAGTAAFMQFHDLLHIFLVLCIFTVGQLVETVWLTPLLVGNKIGLHPVAVIFAIVAGGQLFGFLGILLALPVAAVLMVLLRHVHQKYMHSTLYGGNYM